MPIQVQQKESYNRKFPRKDFKRKIGVLYRGTYFLAQAQDMSEGGISFLTDMVLTTSNLCVLTFQIPNGELVTLKATVKHIKKAGSEVVVGVEFFEISFSNRRQIRNFVASRK